MATNVCMFPFGNVGVKRGGGKRPLCSYVYVGFNAFFFTQMPREKFLTLEEAVEMLLADDSAEATDVVLLPPPSVEDILTDEEEGDSDIAVVDILPNDVNGEIEDPQRLMPTNVKQLCRNKRLRDQKNLLKILVPGGLLHSIRAL
ncbi:hypothetical protein MTO96_034998 [Rhipicephalus appendiculatus]